MGGCTSRKQGTGTFQPPASARHQRPSLTLGFVVGRSSGQKSSSSGRQESSKTTEAEPESEVGQKKRQLKPLQPLSSSEEVRQQRVRVPPPTPQSENAVVGGTTRTPPVKREERTELPLAPTPLAPDENMRFDLEVPPKQPDIVHEGTTSIASRRTPAPSAAVVHMTNTPIENTVKVFTSTSTSPMKKEKILGFKNDLNSAKLSGELKGFSLRTSTDVATYLREKHEPTVKQLKTPQPARPKIFEKRTLTKRSRTSVIKSTQAVNDDDEEKVNIFDGVNPEIEFISSQKSPLSQLSSYCKIGASDCGQLLSPKASTPQALPPSYDDFSPFPIMQFESQDDNVAEQKCQRRKSPTTQNAQTTGLPKCVCKYKPEEHTLYDVSEGIRDLHFDFISDDFL